jgi:hypothetical protein
VRELIFIKYLCHSLPVFLDCQIGFDQVGVQISQDSFCGIQRKEKGTTTKERLDVSVKPSW